MTADGPRGDADEEAEKNTPGVLVGGCEKNDGDDKIYDDDDIVMIF